MLITNTLFIHRIKENNKKVSKKDKASMAFLVLFVTNLFIILTAPDTIANGFFVNELFKTDEGTTILFYLDSILFSFHSLNFFALLFYNKQFSREVKLLMAKLKLINKITPLFSEKTLTSTQRQN